MDLLADIASGLELRSSLYLRAELSAPFAVAVPEDRLRIRLYVAGPGRSWVGMPSGEGAFIESGDVILTPYGSAHILASEPTQQGVPLADVLRSSSFKGGILRHGGGGRQVALVCGQLEFDETMVHPLVELLPPLIHLGVRAGSSFAWIPPLLEALESESRMAEASHRAVTQRISEILFLHLLRVIAAREGVAPGLLALTRDLQLGRALRSIHADPGGDWSLDRLASVAGASRSAFSERFRERTGVTPMRYLADWRMRSARRLLADPALSVSEVGRRVGYASEAAFNRVFRAAVGQPPGRYRRTLLARSAQQLCHQNGQEIATGARSLRLQAGIYPANDLKEERR